MEENQPNTGKYALTYGAILGGVSVVFALMLFSVDMHYQGGAVVMSIAIILPIAAIVFGMIQFRKANDGFMTLSQAMKVGVGIALVGGIIGIVFNQLMTSVIDPEMMNKSMEFQKAALLESTKMTPDQVDAQMELGQSFNTPAIIIAIGLVFSLVTGLIYSLIAGLILKKQKDEY